MPMLVRPASKLHHSILLFCACVTIVACQDVQRSSSLTMKPEYTVHLSPWEYKVLVEKATDPPGNHGYTNHFEPGTYHCRACGAPLFESSAKFHSGCGWPAFDREIPGAVVRKPDFSHGMVRTEILCARCGGHLGHVFEGEGFTPTNTRHCVNSSSIVFHPADKKSIIIGVPDFHHCQEIASRCEGVLSVECGFAGDATYFREALRIEYDPHRTSAAAILTRLIEQTHMTIGKREQWCVFLPPDQTTLDDMWPAVPIVPLVTYQRAPEEHQWFLRKTGIVRRQH